MKYAFALIASAGLASTAFGQAAGTGKIIFETSLDGIAWAGGTRDVAPGTNVQVRVRMQLQGASGVIGLGGCTYQPVVSNWDPATDSRDAFTNATTGAGGADSPTYRGRIFPFSSVGQGSGAASGLLTSFVDGGNSLRFAGANCVTPTTNLSWGVNSAQLTRQLGGTNFVSSLDVVVFKFGVTAGGTTDRTLSIGAPLTSIQNSRQTWFTQDNGSASYLYTLTANDVTGAGIHVLIPTPASMALLGLGGLVAGRRRR